MVIKKKTLVRICIASAIILLVGGFGVHACVEKVQEKRYEQSLLDSYNRAVERKYKELVREYESMVETVKDYDYSADFRVKYIRKINELLGTYQYSFAHYSNYHVIDDFLTNQPIKKEEDLSLLRQQARKKVLED